MPKVTVVTVPAETIADARPIAVSTPLGRRFAWGAVFSLLRSLTLKLAGRQSLPLNLLAFLLGRVVIMGEMAPWGLAFFAAVAQVARERAGAVAFWVLAGVMSNGRYTEAGIYLWSILLYYRMADKFTQLPRRLYSVPMLIFASFTSGGIMLLLWQQITLYNIMLVVMEAAICMISAHVFMYGIPAIAGGSIRKAISGEMFVCTVVILSAAVAGIGTFSIMGYSIRNMAGTLLVLSLAFGGGTGIGAAVGVAMGLVAGLTEGNLPGAIALYSLAGTLAGMFRSLGRYAVILGYILGVSITVLGFDQTKDIMLVLAETAVAAALFLAVPPKWIHTWDNDNWDKADEASTASKCISTAIHKLENISGMFTELAGAFGKISAGTREKIREAEFTRLLAAVGDRVCGECSRRTECWEREFYRTYHAMLEALGVAETGQLSSQTLPWPLKENCLKRAEIMETVSLVAERNSSSLFWQKKIADSRQMVTEQMRATASIIENLAAEIRKEPYSDRHLSNLIKEKSGILGCELGEVRVEGDKGVVTVDVWKTPCAGTRECLNTVLPLAANLLKQKLTLYADCGNDSRRCRLHMKVANRYGVQTGFASVAKYDGSENGDTCSVVNLEQGKFLMMLSDGMGSGSRAANESRAAVSFLERLMTAGFDVGVAVKTVNSMLLLRMPEESFATVDMVVVDAFSGDAEFLKIGSAPSFIKRVREVTTIKSVNLPIGILSQIEIDPVKMSLVPGDIIVMVSDGISEMGQCNTERENWIANFLRRQADAHPQEIADRLLRQALELAGGKARDDMTVLTALIVECPEIKQ